MNNRELVTRTITGFFIALITLGAVVWSPWTFLAWLCIIVLGGTYEYLKLEMLPVTFPLKWIFPPILTALVAALGYWGINSINAFSVFAVISIISGTLFLIQLMMVRESAQLVRLQQAIFTGTAYIGIPVMTGLVFLIGDYDFKFVLVPIFLIWINDIGAYLFGSKWGKHKIAPSISPGKSVEGTIAGGLLAFCTGYTLTWFWPEMPSGYILTVTVATPFFGLAGDLWESALKRNAGVKDSGRLLPGHGGILDRYDSLLFVLPVAALAYYIFVL